MSFKVSFLKGLTSIINGFVQTCLYKKSNIAVKVSTITEIYDSKLNFTNNYLNMMAALQKGPVVAMLQIPTNAPNYGADFYQYASGIYVTPYCDVCNVVINNGQVTASSVNTCFARLNHGKNNSAELKSYI